MSFTAFNLPRTSMSSLTSDASSLKASPMRAEQNFRALRNDVTVAVDGAVDGAGPVDVGKIPKCACDPNMAANNLAVNEMCVTLAAANAVMRNELAAFEVRGSLLGLGRDIPSLHIGLYETSTCPHGLR
jgi:hypothetical protein